MAKIFFLHIPKCAGTSVWTVLGELYGFDRLFAVGTLERLDEFTQMAAEKRASYRAIGGHGSLMDFTKAIEDWSSYFRVTTFRHPIDRLVSEYQFIASSPTHFAHNAVSAMSFSDYLMMDEAHNLQTRLICGEANAERALEVVEQTFDDWGLTEDMEPFFARLYVMAGQNVQIPQRQNRGQEHLELTRKAAADIEDRNGADMAFYSALVSLAKRRRD